MFRRCVLFALIALTLSVALTLSGSDVSFALTKDVGFWRMNELSGPVAHDSAGGHHGTAYNVSFGQPGHEGKAYGFNGINSVVRVPHADDLNPRDANFSYGAWVRFTALPPPQTFDIIRKGTSSSSGYYKLELFNSNNSARARCYAKGSSGSATITGGTNLNNGQWHKLTCTRTGSKWQISVDGANFSKTDSFGRVANTAQVTIGAKPTNDDFFNGLIDDARITTG